MTIARIVTIAIALLGVTFAIAHRTWAQPCFASYQCEDILGLNPVSPAFRETMAAFASDPALAATQPMPRSLNLWYTKPISSPDPSN
jgi:hypothetical protein